MTTNKTPCLAALNIAGVHYPCQEPAPHDGWAHANKDAGAIWASDLDPVPGMPAWEEYERQALVPTREGRHITSDRYDCWCEPRAVKVEGKR